MDFYTELHTLLATPPGSLVYHSILVFSIASALQAAIAQWRATEFPQARRMAIGLGVLLASQLVMFAAGALVWQGLLDGAMWLPPLERAVIGLSVAILVWLWAFPEPAKMSDAGVIVVGLGVGLALALSLMSRGSHDGAPYNSSMQAMAWAAVSMIGALLGTLILIVRQPAGWSNGLTFFALAFSGQVLDMLLPVSTDNYSGIVRLSLLAAFPLLLTLPQRYTYSEEQRPARRARPAYEPKQGSAEQQEEERRDRRRYSTDPKTLHSLLNLAAELDASKINQHITRSVAQAMLSDLCFLIYISDDKSQLMIGSGYDLIREEAIDGGLIPRDSIPMLANAVQKGKALRLPASSTSSDLKGLSDMLGLPSAGNLLNVPILSEKSGPIGGLLLISPYSSRQWTAEDQTFLTNIAPAFVPVIERGRRMSALEQERDRTQRLLDEAREQAAALEARKQEFEAQMESLQTRSEQIDAVLVIEEEQKRTIEQLQRELNELKSHPVPAADEGASLEYYEKELRLTLQEVARLQNSLAEAEMRIVDMEHKPASAAHGKLTGDQTEVIASISQELRQPMSSIIGYADLLLGESVGILGALQRKFIERIKSSTERIGALVDDLIHVTTLESGLQTLRAETVDLNLIIDNAMAYTTSQMREKNITLRIDIQKNIPPIEADRESLQQILIHLIQNAGAVTPIEGTVILRVRMENEEGHSYVLMQVTDSGGGIAAEDIERVFSRLYRADNVLIEGVGDTGVGLSIAKAMTEAHNGRIWVDSQPGQGATFSVLLPVGQTAKAIPNEG